MGLSRNFGLSGVLMWNKIEDRSKASILLSEGPNKIKVLTS